jgi:hypothetical protein
MFKLLSLLCLFSSFVVLAEEKQAIPICSMLYASSVKKIVEANGTFDKFKHCSVSCMLTLRCPAIDVLEIGILKELADVVGPGNAEMDDLRADYAGVDLVVSKKARTDRNCMDQCHSLYPEGTCH